MSRVSRAPENRRDVLSIAALRGRFFVAERDRPRAARAAPAASRAPALGRCGVFEHSPSRSRQPLPGSLAQHASRLPPMRCAGSGRVLRAPVGADRRAVPGRVVAPDCWCVLGRGGYHRASTPPCQACAARAPPSRLGPRCSMSLIAGVAPQRWLCWPPVAALAWRVGRVAYCAAEAAVPTAAGGVGATISRVTSSR